MISFSIWLLTFALALYSGYLSTFATSEIMILICRALSLSFLLTSFIYLLYCKIEDQTEILKEHLEEETRKDIMDVRDKVWDEGGKTREYILDVKREVWNEGGKTREYVLDVRREVWNEGGKTREDIQGVKAKLWDFKTDAREWIRDEGSRTRDKIWDLRTETREEIRGLGKEIKYEKIAENFREIKTNIEYIKEGFRELKEG